MSPEIDRPLPPYLQVVNHLRDRIVTGQLAEGAAVLSERQLAEEWGISRATATKVLGVLRAEGLVTSRQGTGTVVTARAGLHHSAADRARTMQTTGRIYPPGQYAKILSAGLAPAHERAAEALGIEPGQEAIRRQRVTCNEDGPVSASASWFSAELAETVPQLLVAERIPGGTPQAIEDATGWAWTHTEEVIHSRIATDEDAELLGITTRPAALLVGYNRLVDAEGRVVEYGEYISHGDRATRYTSSRPRD